MQQNIETIDLENEDETALRMRMAPGTLAVWRCRRFGPPFIRVGRRIFYDPRDVSRWLEDNKMLNPSQGAVESDEAAKHTPGGNKS